MKRNNIFLLTLLLVSCMKVMCKYVSKIYVNKQNRKETIETESACLRSISFFPSYMRVVVWTSRDLLQNNDKLNICNYNVSPGKSGFSQTERPCLGHVDALLPKNF